MKLLIENGDKIGLLPCSVAIHLTITHTLDLEESSVVIDSGIKHDKKGWILMAEIKLKVVYEPYYRNETDAPTISIGHITAPTFREAIIKMLSKVEAYINIGDVEVREDEMGREMTQEELIEALVQDEGDTFECDCIISLTNEVTGEIYIEPKLFEEWTI